MASQQLQNILEQAKGGSTLDLCKLLTIGREKGFQNFVNRKSIWPFLLQIDVKGLETGIFEWEKEFDRNCSDFQQLQKDAERSLSSMKTFENITKFHLQKRQRDVLKILDSFFAKNTDLKYIQGFHDVASIFLVVFGSSPGYYMMQKAGKVYFRQYLTGDVGCIGQEASKMVMELLRKKDKDFQQIFECFEEMGMISFIISWLLTWFAHVFSSVKVIARIWDYILCTGPHAIIYITTGVILSAKEELLKQCQQLDHASIQMFFQQKMKNEGIDVNLALKLAMELELEIGLENCQSYAQLNKSSYFRNETFELHLDIHRRAKEYNKEKASKQALKKNLVVFASVVLTAFTVAYLYGFKKIIG